MNQHTSPGKPSTGGTRESRVEKKGRPVRVKAAPCGRTEPGAETNQKGSNMDNGQRENAESEQTPNSDAVEKQQKD